MTAFGLNDGMGLPPILASISSLAVVPRIGPGSATDAGSVWPPARMTGVPIWVMA
ncbi:MAG: hypothetical protein WBB72_12910 [Methyloceanibacter sp.]